MAAILFVVVMMVVVAAEVSGSGGPGKSRTYDLLLFYYWPIVFDVGPKLKQHWGASGSSAVTGCV